MNLFDSDIDALRENLIFDIVSSSKGELTTFERLFIVNHLSYLAKTNQRWLVDLYTKCGCFLEAKKIYKKLCHWRKLGDLAWIDHNLSLAEDYYSKDKNKDGIVFRGSKDWDRLIKLSFYQSEWEKVIKIIFQANISKFGNNIILGSSSTSAKPYLKMLAVSISKLNIKNDPELSNNTCKTFPITKKDWDSLLCSLSTMTNEELAKLQEKAIPRITKTKQISFQNALKKGNTIRAIRISSALESIEILLNEAVKCMHTFLQREDKKALSKIVEIIDSLTDENLAKTFLTKFTTTVFESRDNKLNNNLVVDFYEAHPLFRRFYFGELLKLKFKNNIRISTSDLYTGLLQSISSISADINEQKFRDPLLNFNKIIAFSDWVEMKIGTWLNTEGEKSLQIVVDTWNQQKAKPVKSPFNSIKRSPNNPREMIEWIKLTNDLHIWITQCWKVEIGDERWKSEKILFELVKKTFKGYEVQRHAQPLWLEPQHLDIFLPELALAIEYMGEQHYRPIEYFGGEEGFQAAVSRDRHKAEICKQTGINLIYVRFDDDIKQKVEEINKECL